MAAKSKKLATAAVAVTTAAALLLGGTFAWQSISQEATNIVTNEVNPGGRLHDDFDGENDKNVYVENFGTQNIYARIKLSEYLEIGPNAGDTEYEKRAEYLENGDIEVLLGENIDDKSTYKTYYYGEENLSDEYWTKDWDGSTLYIPTFNKNQDSLAADLNGTFEYVNDEGESDPYGDNVDINETYIEGAEVTGDEIVDADANDVDEGAEAIEGNNITTEIGVVHKVAESINGSVISMAEYNELSEEEKAELNAWVYDIDGWAYWSQAIEPGTATGLLLDSITDLGYIDEDYYYAILVTGQFITAGDIGAENNTGFYTDFDTDGGPTGDALALLESIGVKVDGENEEGGEGGEGEDPYGFSNMLFGTDTEKTKSDTFVGEGYAQPGDTVVFNVAAYYNNGDTIELNAENTKWSIEAVEGELDDGTSISDGVVTISENQGDLSVLEFTATYTDQEGTKYAKSAHILVSTEAITLSVELAEEGPYYTDVAYTATATATNKSGKTVPMVWTYDLVAADESENMDVQIDGNKVWAMTAGEYKVRAWPEYMWGQYAEENVTIGQNQDSGTETETEYSISIDDTALIASDDTTGLAIRLTNAEGEAVTEGVTWEVSNENATVSEEGYLKATESAAMTTPLEMYTVTAYVGEEKVASYDFYMYNAEQHVIYGRDYSIVTLDSGNTYCLFSHTVTTYIAVENEGCIWKFGDAVENIYCYYLEGNFDAADIAGIFERYLNGEDVLSEYNGSMNICDSVLTEE